jgi:ATP-binding cassette, subfamily B (MDR/TAP), member 1
MGEGVVMESGTHNDLIQAGGAYARLVQSQKLRKGRQSRDPLDAIDHASEDLEHSTEKVVDEEIPLGRKITGHSLASDILEKRRQAMGASDENEKDYDLPYLFKRMFLLVRDQWKKYLFGFLFACCTRSIFRLYSFFFTSCL